MFSEALFAFHLRVPECPEYLSVTLESICNDEAHQLRLSRADEKLKIVLR